MSKLCTQESLRKAISASVAPSAVIKGRYYIIFLQGVYYLLKCVRRKDTSFGCEELFFREVNPGNGKAVTFGKEYLLNKDTYADIGGIYLFYEYYLVKLPEYSSVPSGQLPLTNKERIQEHLDAIRKILADSA